MVQVVPPVGWKHDSSLDVVPVALSIAPSKKISASDSAVGNPVTTNVPATGAAAKMKAASVVPPALPSRPALPQTGAVAASVAGAAVVSQPQIPIAAPRPQLPAQPPAPAAGAPATANLPARTLSFGSVPLSFGAMIAARIQQDAILLSGGLVGGILLGATVWLVLWSQTPTVQTVAETVPRAESVPVRSPVAAAPEAAGATASEQTGPSAVEAQVTEPRSPPEASAAPAESAPQEGASAAAVREAEEERKTVADVLPPPAVAPKEHKESTGPAIKLDPAPAVGAAAVGALADSPAGPATAADEAVENPKDVVPNRGGVSGASGNPANASRLLSSAQIEERLAGALPAVNFVKVPLAQFLEFIGDFTNLSITIDARALESLNQGRQTPVSVKLSDTTAGDALRTALAKLALTCSARDGKVVIMLAKDKPAAR